ncbi:MAG: vanadium-dependent haloperoxidase [Rhodocyclaceae bacterium]|nr:vanadium-dependent haloperoxidase [Rhodocyclaceae bacterium]
MNALPTPTRLKLTLKALPAACLLATFTGASALAPGQPDVVAEWNARLVQVMNAVPTHGPMQARNFAIMNVAMFEAINATAPRYQSYAGGVAPQPGAAPEAAAATAAYRVLARLYPSQAEQLGSALAKDLEKLPDGPARRAGSALGEAAAAATLAAREKDGAEQPGIYEAPDTSTAYQPNPGAKPVAPAWGKVPTWVLPDASAFRPPAPPRPGSTAYKHDYQEVKSVGGKDSTVRSPDQTDAARFWMILGTEAWVPVLRKLSEARGQTLAESSRVYALVALAASDAMSACWDAKYTYSYYRPVTAIRAGNGAGEFAPDPAWEPAIPTPPFPAYVSGHACYSGAAQRVLEGVFGRDADLSITLTSRTAPGVSRRFARIGDVVEDISNARVWGGIHWRTDQTMGVALGGRVGAYVLEHALQPLPADQMATRPR